MFKEDLQTLNDLLRRNLSQKTRTHMPVLECPDFIRRVLATDNINLLDTYGEKLKNFCENVDFEHPAAIELFNCFYDHTIIKFCEEILQISHYELPILKEFILKKLESNKLIFDKIKKIPVSLLKDKQKIIEKRKNIEHSCFDIDFNEIHENMLSYYVRLENCHNDEINHLQEQEAILSDAGLTTISSKVSRDKNKLKTIVDNNYCGFYRLNFSTIAHALANAHSLCKNMMENYIFEKDYFIKPFWFTKDTPCPPTASPFYEKQIKLAIKSFKCIIRTYSLSELDIPIPTNCKEFIDICEEHPDTNHKPFFDNYCLFVPTVHYPSELFYANGLWMSYINNEFKTYENSKMAVKLLDNYLIESGNVIPALFGEKNDFFYFISYFA